MSETYHATFEGNTIEIEGRVTSIFGSAEYDLILNGKRADRITGSLGDFVLRGELHDTSGAPRRVLVRIDQGIATTKYRLDIDGIEYRLLEGRVD